MADPNPQLSHWPLKLFLPLVLQYIIFDFLVTTEEQSGEIRDRYQTDNAKVTVAAAWRRVKMYLDNGLPDPLPQFYTLKNDAAYFSQTFEDRLSVVHEDEHPVELSGLLTAANERRACDDEMINLTVHAAIWFGKNRRWPDDTTLAELDKWVRDPGPQDEDMAQQDSNVAG